MPVRTSSCASARCAYTCLPDSGKETVVNHAGYAIGGGKQSVAQSSGVALAEMDSDIYVAGHFSGFKGAWPGYTGPSRNRAPAGGSPSFGVEGVDELIGFKSSDSSDAQVSTFLSKLVD